MALRSLVFLVAFAFSLFFPATGTRAAQKEILIGLVPEMNIFRQMERYQPLALYLSEKADVKVRLTVLNRYGNILVKIQEKKLDGAILGSFTGALAIARLGLEPLARPVNPDGTSTYKGYIFVRKDGGIRSVRDMKGKRMALVERATTAGYVFPLAWLRERGVGDLSGYFGQHYFTGSHDAAIYEVLNGQANVGAAKNTVYDMLKKEHSRVDNELMVLAESAEVPSNGLCVRKDMDAALKKRLKKALLEMESDRRGREVLAEMGFVRFISTSARDYDPVFRMAEKAGIDIKKYDYYNP